jgi:FkbM family methyltransferase
MANGADGDTLLTLRSLQHPILVRPGTEDIRTIVSNVLREEYGQLSATFNPSIVVDAGAYIGDTAAYFLTRFQDATVFALEPSEESHARAVRNLAPYGDRVVLLKRALWNTATTVRFSGCETSASISSSGVSIDTDTIPALMSRFGLRRIDLLKLDIDGAEAVVIPSGLGGWLRNVGVILLETHGDEIERTVLPMLIGEGFACRRHRNVWYCTNTSLSTS